MKSLTIFAPALLLSFNLFAALPPEYEAMKAEAEKFYADGSFAKAHELYARMMLMSNITSNEARWVFFRNYDTQWRSDAATQNADTTKLDEARTALEREIRDLTREDQHDVVWAETQESLGDFFWTRRNYNRWDEAWPHYQAALDWWAGQSDLELARQRYLKIVWRMEQPLRVLPYYNYDYLQIPLDVLENALKIAQSDNDKAHAHFLIARMLRNQRWSVGEQIVRVPEEFEAAIKIGRTDWYDDALFNYAQWMENEGHIAPLEIAGMPTGAWRYAPDYVKALELYCRLVGEFKKGETRYWESAVQRISDINGPQVGVSVPNIFLPGSEIQYNLSWRNVKQIDLALYAVELNRDVKFPAEQENRSDWLPQIDLSAAEKIKSWTRTTNDKGLHEPSNEVVRLEMKLKPGAYVLEASAGGKSARELVLVTDAALVVKTSGKQALVYFCNALDSSPVANGKVALWEGWWDQHSRWHWREHTASTDKDGIAVFDLGQPEDRGREIFVSAAREDRQAFSTAMNNWFYHPDDQPWRIYAFTDRPAYRPKETVNWKFIARRYDGSVYSTPAGETVWHEIRGPDGSLVRERELKLNAFGSVFGSLELTEAMRLGEYQVLFYNNKNREREIGRATLFWLEEYKLPEFKVEVKTPEEEGPDNVTHRKTFRLGEKVEATIQADYYFGGPVADANVEVIVHQNPLYQIWHKPHDFPWLYEDMDNGASPYGRYGRYQRWYGGEQIITNATLKTDATGKATLMFDTPANQNQDFEYRIEARITDSSRREITGNGAVRVTRQRYYVYAEPDHNLYRPQDKVRVNFKALDANEQPVQTQGTVKITRDYWYEIWLAPDGHEVKGAELKRLQLQSPTWPPPPARPDQRDWHLKFSGYEHDEILTRSLKTDTNGEAELNFTPEREGYYRVAWTSEDASRIPHLASRITAETTVWVARNATTDLGYRHDGVEIIADRDTFRVGQRAPVMLATQTPDRYVLFTVEGGDLYNYQLVHVTGTVKLIELPVEEKHTPNIFLGATLVSDRQIFTDTKQIIVPPTKNFLTVDVKPDRTQYQPRDEGTLTVTTRNDEGKPVSAEVALGLVDESVFYIQGDYAGDPRQFYFGTKRYEQIQTQGTMNQKSYAKLIPWENNQLIDEREKSGLERAKRREVDLRDAQKTDWDESGSTFGPGGGGGGGGGGGANFFAINGAVPLTGALRLPPGRVFNRASISGSAGNMALGFETGERRKAAKEGMFDRLSVEEPAAAPAPMTGPEPVVVVRSDFRSTVFWQPDIVTDEHGEATVKVKYPDSLTSWKATARAVSQKNQFGIAEAATRTRQPLIVRLEAPRFFVVGDTVTISAVINNNTESELTVQPGIDYAGLTPPPAPAAVAPQGPVAVPANGEKRVDWTFAVSQPGEVKLKVTARGGKFADAMERTFTAYEHGIEKFISKSGKARLAASKPGEDGGNDITVKLDLPHERKAGSTSLTVQVTPSMAVTMLDALPYLIDYPYGCTEQTMSRFLPAAITAKTLRDLGLKPEDVMGRIFGGIETNSAAATHPKGTHDLAELDKITSASLERLYDFQHSDGGWGWWKPGDSDHWMTAYVVWGLSLARDAGVQIKEDALRRAANYLDEHLVDEEENPDMQAWMLHAYSVYISPYKNNLGELGKFINKAEDNLWHRREQLNAYTRALFALAEHNLDHAAHAQTLVENLENGVIDDERPDQSVLIQPSTSSQQPSTIQGTTHWGEDSLYWHWSEGGVEATAFALRAMLAIDPTNKLVEPTANWLLKNRRGAQWNNTRDTAIVVLAMNDYLRASGELKTDMEFDVLVNGETVAHRQVSGADVFSAPSRFAIDPKLIQDHNEVRIKVSRASKESRPAALYFAVEGKYFSLEEPISPAGNEIFVKREYYKLSSRPTLLKGYVYDRAPLRDGEDVKSGDRVETVLTIEGKNNYEYLLFEDLKPAGLEAAEIRSGENLYAQELKSGAAGRKFSGPGPASPSTLNTQLSTDDYTGRTRWVYEELRDRKVALFIDKLPQGIWEIHYEMRAEVPGRFHALPVTGQAMYVPEIRCNGAEVRIQVLEGR